jgi:nucleoside phosphorylase
LLARNDEALARIRSAWPGEKPDHVLAVRVGPLASGAAVLADGQSIERIVDQHRELLAVEMEAYGLFAAAAEAADPRPLAVVMKSVVDFGDKKKSDDVQRYAAFVSSEVLKLIFESVSV